MTVYGLGPTESEIFEVLIRENGRAIKTNKIHSIIYEKYGTKIKERAIIVAIWRFNKKFNDLIKVKKCSGYWIEEEIKLMY